MVDQDTVEEGSEDVVAFDLDVITFVGVRSAHITINSKVVQVV